MSDIEELTNILGEVEIDSEIDSEKDEDLSDFIQSSDEQNSDYETEGESDKEVDIITLLIKELEVYKEKGLPSYLKEAAQIFLLEIQEGEMTSSDDDDESVWSEYSDDDNRWIEEESEDEDDAFVCPKCEKEYKTERGLKSHVQKCEKPQRSTRSASGNDS